MKRSLKQWLVGSAALLFMSVCFTLSGCDTHPPAIPLSEMRVTSVLTPSQQQRLLSQIKSAGVQVVQQGTRLQLFLPKDKFFSGQTTTLRYQQITCLRLIALYLHNYGRNHVVHYPIKVYAFTGTVHTRQYRQADSIQLAQVIASYLWNHGFNPNQMSVLGQGAKNPIASYRTPIGNAYNNYVLIQVN